MNQEVNFWKVRDLGDIINASFLFVKLHLRNLIMVLLYVAGPFLLLTAIMNVWFQSNLVMPSMDEQVDNPFAVFQMFTDVRFYLAMIAGMVGSFVLYSAMYSYVMLARDGIEPSVDSVWQRIREDFGVYFTTVLWIVAFYIVSIFLFVICIGILIWIPAVIYLGTILVVYVPVRLHERVGTFDAVRRCKELNQGLFVDGFLLVIVLVIITIALAMIFMIPSMVVSFLYGLNSFAGNASTPVWAILITTLCQMAASLTSIVPITASILQYGNLVERFESPGLADRIENWADSHDGNGDNLIP